MLKKFFDRLSWQAIFAAFLAVFFLRNVLVPFAADDYSYMFIWDGAGNGNLLDSIDPNRLHRVESLGDIFISQWQHYFTWGGRTIAHTFAQFFIWQGDALFNVANTFVFAAMVLLLFKVGTGLPLREMNKSYLLFILAAIYFCAPSLFLTTVWLTGSCNYLWMCTLEILFLLPFALTYRRKKIVPCFLFLIPFIALIAGWSIEPGAAATVFVTLLFALHFKREKNFRPWMKIVLIFLTLGFMILMFAPGNLHRLALISGLSGNEFMTPDDTWSLQTFERNFAEGFLPTFLREMILFVPIIFYFVKARTSPEVSRFILMFAAGSMLILAFMMFSPMFPERAGFPSTIFLLVASLAALKEILPDVKNFCRRRIKIMTFAASIFAVYWSLSLLGCLYVEYDFRCQVEERYKIVAEHRNDDVVVVPPIKLPPWSETFLGSRTWDEFTLVEGGDLKPAYFNNRNITFARRHGLKKIVTQSD